MNALVLDDTAKKMLEDQEKFIVRKLFKFRSRATTTPLLMILNTLPIINIIHIAMFSLFHNMWIKPTNEMTRIMYHILDDKTLKKPYWITEMERLTDYYEIPSIKELKQQNPPTKNEWKK